MALRCPFFEFSMISWKNIHAVRIIITLLQIPMQESEKGVKLFGTYYLAYSFLIYVY